MQYFLAQTLTGMALWCPATTLNALDKSVTAASTLTLMVPWGGGDQAFGGGFKGKECSKCEMLENSAVLLWMREHDVVMSMWPSWKVAWFLRNQISSRAKAMVEEMSSVSISEQNVDGGSRTSLMMSELCVKLCSWTQVPSEVNQMALAAEHWMRRW